MSEDTQENIGLENRVELGLYSNFNTVSFTRERLSVLPVVLAKNSTSSFVQGTIIIHYLCGRIYGLTFGCLNFARLLFDSFITFGLPY